MERLTAIVHAIAIDGETIICHGLPGAKSGAAVSAGAQGVILDIRTLGGRVDAALKMRDTIITAEVPVVVFISSRAVSAGALIAIAADTIVMAPGSHIGAAEPIPLDPKTLAVVSSEFRTTAERTGRDPQVAASMVDRSIVIDGLIGDGEILDLTADEALAWGFADHLAADQNEVLQIMGWADAHIVHVRQSFQFRIAQFLTGAEIATLLLSFGMLGLVVELFTPGFGAPGFVGIGCLVLYFGGTSTGAANYWGALLFVVGIILLAIEIIVPGFGIWGISGLTALVVGIILAAPNPTQGMGTLLIASAVTLIAIPVFFRIFGKTHFMQRFVLKTAETVNQGYTHADKSHLLGQTGRTLTVLRPSGSILIDGMRIDALADGTYPFRCLG